MDREMYLRLMMFDLFDEYKRKEDIQEILSQSLFDGTLTQSEYRTIQKKYNEFSEDYNDYKKKRGETVCLKT